MTDWKNKTLSLTIVMAGVLTVAACGNTEQDEATMRQLAKRFEAESQAAQTAPRLAISGHLSRLSEIRLDLSELEISENCQELKSHYLGAFETVEAAYSAFARTETDTVVAATLMAGMSDLGLTISRSCDFYELNRLAEKQAEKASIPTASLIETLSATASNEDVFPPIAAIESALQELSKEHGSTAVFEELSSRFADSKIAAFERRAEYLAKPLDDSFASLSAMSPEENVFPPIATIENALEEFPKEYKSTAVFKELLSRFPKSKSAALERRAKYLARTLQDSFVVLSAMAPEEDVFSPIAAIENALEEFSKDYGSTMVFKKLPGSFAKSRSVALERRAEYLARPLEVSFAALLLLTCSP